MKSVRKIFSEIVTCALTGMQVFIRPALVFQLTVAISVARGDPARSAQRE